MIPALAVITRIFQISNYVEACLWWAIAGVIARKSRSWSRPARIDALILVINLVLFGASDVVEAQTGAWWRPWWLLAWKGACLFVALVLAWRYLSRRG